MTDSAENIQEEEDLLLSLKSHSIASCLLLLCSQPSESISNSDLCQGF